MEGGAHRQSHGKKHRGQNKRMVGMVGDLAGKERWEEGRGC